MEIELLWMGGDPELEGAWTGGTGMLRAKMCHVHAPTPRMNLTIMYRTHLLRHTYKIHQTLTGPGHRYSVLLGKGPKGLADQLWSGHPAPTKQASLWPILEIGVFIEESLMAKKEKVGEWLAQQEGGFPPLLSQTGLLQTSLHTSSSEHLFKTFLVLGIELRSSSLLGMCFQSAS